MGEGRLLGVSAIIALTAGACIGKIGPDGANDTAGTGGAAATGRAATGRAAVEKYPFEPVSARIYVAKVKNLMLGQAADRGRDRRGRAGSRRPCATWSTPGS